MDAAFSRLLGALVAAVLVAVLARRRRALSASGAVAAVPIGAVVVGGGGWWAGAVLVAFFVTSSALSRVTHRRPAASIAVRGSERDGVQVLANGGAATLLAGAVPLASPDCGAVLFAAFAGAIAAATADTWATELGGLSRAFPRLVVGWRTVPAGTSGGVTALGGLGAVAGAALIAAVAVAGVPAGWAPGRWDALLLGTVAAGIAGAFADSVLGATLQAAYRCPACDRPTERRVHGCGAPTVLVRGHPAVTNDGVNAVATVVGAVVGLAGALLAP